MATDNLKSAIYKVVYEGKDITEDLRPMLLSIRYVDSVEGESSSMEISLENTDSLWSNGWYPNKGEKITLSIGDLDCGTFTIDEVELSGPPDILRIMCLENMITKQQLKTKRSKAHENKTLRQIAQHVASANNLTLVGNVPNIQFERVSQHRETDLKFLRRISYQFGIVFSVRDDKLVYTKLSELDKKKASFTIHRTQMIGYKCVDKTFNTFSAVMLKYQDAKTGDVISHSAKDSGEGGIVTLRNADGLPCPQIVSGNTLILHHRVESKQQAIISAESMLYRCNTLQQSGEFSIEGTELAVAGVNLEITGLGMACSGIWNIRKASHSVDRSSNWLVSIEAKRLALISAERAKAKAQQATGASSGGFADLIGTGNMGSGTSFGASDDKAYENRNRDGEDITKEKQQVQSALRFLIDRVQDETYKFPLDLNVATRNIKAALSQMVAKKQNETAQTIRVRYNDIYPGFSVYREDEERKMRSIEKAEQLISDIPPM